MLYRFLPHLAHFVYHLVNLNMGSHPDGITPKHGLRVRHCNIHIEKNSRKLMSNWLCRKFWISNRSSDVSPLYSIWTQKRSLKMFLNIFNTKPGTKKAMCISGTPCTLWILSFRPHYKFSYLWNHRQPWLESQTPPHLHYGKFSKFEVKRVKI